MDILECLGVLRIPILVIVITYVLLTAIWYLWYFYVVLIGTDRTSIAPLPPGGMGWPIIGESYQFIMQDSGFTADRLKRYNTRIFKTHLFGRPTIRVSGPENLHTVLHGELNLVESQWPQSTRNLLGDVLSLSTGDRHTVLRKHMSKAFSHDALDGYIPMALPLIQTKIDYWCTQKITLALDSARQLFLEVACTVLCGFDVNELEGGVLADTFKEYFNGFFTLPFDLPGTSYRKALLAKTVLREKLVHVMERKMKISSSEDKKDALRILMDRDEDDKEVDHMTNETISGHVLDLLNGGFNTTSSAATTLLYHISQNPQVMTNIRSELARLTLLDRNNILTFDRLNECKYLTNVVLEGLRMAPPVGGGFRRVLKTFELDGYQIPRGWTIIYSIRDTVQQSDSYTNPSQFDPDRFSPDRQEHLIGGRYNFPLFGGGPRSCMGKQFALLILRILLVELARTCTVEPIEEGPVKFKYMPIPYPVNGLPLTFTALKPGDVMKDTAASGPQIG